MIPEVLVSESLRDARRTARECVETVQQRTGCHMLAIVAELVQEGRACSSMAVDKSLEHDPQAEIALMKCALTRVLSLLVLHLGVHEALSVAMSALAQGEDLARTAQRQADSEP